MNNRESCYVCDYFYEKSEMHTGEIDGYPVILCPECAEKL